MIREAMPHDIPAIGRMVAELHALMPTAMPFDGARTATSLAALQARPDGLLLVAERDGRPMGFIAASIGFASMSEAPVAFEHGWYARPTSGGQGLRLLLEYERWAKERGCRFIRMCTPPHNEQAATVLEKRGFAIAELCWAKALT